MSPGEVGFASCPARLSPGLPILGFLQRGAPASLKFPLVPSAAFMWVSAGRADLPHRLIAWAHFLCRRRPFGPWGDCPLGLSCTVSIVYKVSVLSAAVLPGFVRKKINKQKRQSVQRNFLLFCVFIRSNIMFD